MSKEVYVGVGDTAALVSDIFVGVDEKAQKVSKGYVGVDGIAQEFYNANILKTITMSGTGKESQCYCTVDGVDYYSDGEITTYSNSIFLAATHATGRKTKFT